MASNIELCSDEGGQEMEEHREDCFIIDLSTGQRLNEGITEIEDKMYKSDSEKDEKENDSREALQTFKRKDSSENIVIEIRPTAQTPSPPPEGLRRSGSMENVSAKDYLVVRANRKLKIKQKNLELQNDTSYDIDNKFKFPTESATSGTEIPSESGSGTISQSQDSCSENEKVVSQELKESACFQNEITSQVKNQDELIEQQQKSVEKDQMEKEYTQVEKLAEVVGSEMECSPNFQEIEDNGNEKAQGTRTDMELSTDNIPENQSDFTEKLETDDVNNLIETNNAQIKEKIHPYPSMITSVSGDEKGSSPFFLSDEEEGDNIQVATFCMQSFDDDIDELLKDIPEEQSEEEISKPGNNHKEKNDNKMECSSNFQKNQPSALNDTFLQQDDSMLKNLHENGTFESPQSNVAGEDSCKPKNSSFENEEITNISTEQSLSQLVNETTCEDQYAASSTEASSEKTILFEDNKVNELSNTSTLEPKESDLKNDENPKTYSSENKGSVCDGYGTACVFKTILPSESICSNLSHEVWDKTIAPDTKSTDNVSNTSSQISMLASNSDLTNTKSDSVQVYNFDTNSQKQEFDIEGASNLFNSTENQKANDSETECFNAGLQTDQLQDAHLNTDASSKDPQDTPVIKNINTESSNSTLQHTSSTEIFKSDISSKKCSHEDLESTSSSEEQVKNASDNTTSSMEQLPLTESNQTMSPKEKNTLSESNLIKNITPEMKSNCLASQSKSTPKNNITSILVQTSSSENECPDRDLSKAILTPDCDLTKTKSTPDSDLTKTMLTPDSDLTKTTSTPDSDLTKTMSTPDSDLTKTMSTSENNINCFGNDSDVKNVCVIVLKSEKDVEIIAPSSDCSECNAKETLSSDFSNEVPDKWESFSTSTKSSKEADSSESDEEGRFEIAPVDLTSCILSESDPESLNEKQPENEGNSNFDVLKHELLKNIKLKSCTKTDSVTTDGDFEVEEIMRNEVINDSELFQPIASVAAEICNEFTDDSKEAVFLDEAPAEDRDQTLGRWSDSYLSGCTSGESVYEDATDSSGEDYTTWDTFQCSLTLQESFTEAEKKEVPPVKIVEVPFEEIQDDEGEIDESKQYKTVINLDSLQEKTQVQNETKEDEEPINCENKCVIVIDKKPNERESLNSVQPVARLEETASCMMVVPWRKRTQTCPCILKKKRLQVMAKKYVKGHGQASLVNQRKKLYDIIHSLNKKETISLPNASDFDNDMIWRLLKTLISPKENLFSENEAEKSASPSSNTEKEDLVKVFTYLHPSSNKTKFEFIPLKTPRKKTLPFSVKELFNKEVTKARKKKEVSRGLIFLKMVTGKNMFIKEKGSPKNKMSKNKDSKDTDATIKSPKMFKMSSTQLVLPKLNLIGRSPCPRSSAPSPKELLESSLLSKKSQEIEEMSHDASPTLNNMLSVALEMLHTSRLDDAENQLLRLYQRMQEKPEDNTRILVQCLSNLSDICVRRSRMCRSNQMEWQWLVMHAIALLQYTVEICDSEIEATTDNQDVEWFQEYRQNIVTKCKPLEDSFNRALYNCLKHEGRKFMDPFRSFSLPNTPTMPNRLGLFPLASSHQFYINPGLNYKYSSTLNREKKETVDDISVGLDWLSKFYRYCNDRLQTKNLGDIYNKLFKKRSRVDSLRHEDDTESVVSDSAGSLDWDHSDLQGIDELESEEPEESPVTEQTFALAVAECDMEHNGWDFFLNERKNCKFTSVVQVASQNQNETEKLENRAISKTKENENEVKEKEIISPLHEHSIKHTLAKSYARLAEKMLSEGDLDKAEVLFEQVLNIIEEIHDGTAGMLRFGAKISKFLGTIKSKQGKTAEGLEYLNTALKTYRDLQDNASNYEIAVALLELGNGYSVGKSNDDGVFEDAIAAICEFFEKDLSDENMSSSSSSGKSDTVNSRTAEEEENIEEAIHCYREALSLLDAYGSENQMDIVAKSTMRLGDCYFMQKDYDRALECYEKSLSLFHSSSTLGRESMIEHAHVTCMVGVCSFMLHMYPRAVSTFELALHLIKYAYGLTSTFIHALLLSMMGITYYKMKNYHKCVTMCYQGFEIFCSIYGEKLPTLPKRKFWLVCQILYVMGNSYNILNLHQKAVKYLTVARTLMMACKMRERRQFMRVLQVLGDCYFAQYDYKTALQFYNEALEYGDCESQVSFDEVFDPNAIGDNMTMHNQLVSKSAEAHISMQQYQNAVHYLEQAHDMQEDMGNDIKEDLIHTLTQLGQMHSSAGDVEQAIDSFNESLEVYREIHDGKLGKEMCSTLGNLATMCYVKACLCEEIDSELEMILTTEQHFQDAMALDLNPSVCVKYANFLYSQANYDDAIMYLEDALKIEGVEDAPDITYGGLEKVTLPDCLQDEVDSQEEVVLSPTVLARYLLILSHKAMHQSESAMQALTDLQADVLDRDIPIFYSVLGYAMMEMSLFEEAMWCFSCAVDIESDYRLALDNYSLCLCIYLYKTFIKGIEAICQHAGLPCYYNM
ncbi:uncharacterized protein LOC133178039 [Saccostrea echinata]|uniref:uncharacterized protein LOC133178039 n=1 Tax=Saccostrea echinata TaxID=191078 RepID=UPI002A83F491|nr:uncharacterized protein LOC133178039 [Saccostrea echinata]